MLLPRLISGSIGSVVTALAVTPLEVVKVRQQASSATNARTTARNAVSPGPEVVTRCRGCGTFVLNNGLAECVLPRSAVPYFGPGSGTGSNPAPGAASAAVGRAPSVVRKAVADTTSGDGTFTVLRRIFKSEGISGIYAGLAPTLVMSVPNTVLYFTSYDEIVGRLRGWGRSQPAAGGATAAIGKDDAELAANPLLEKPFEPSPQQQSVYDTVLVPLVGGSSARLLATAATSPLELVRTRQASRVGMGATSSGSAPVSMVAELRTMIKTEGYASLYRGLAPTLWRDVPFSAIYWMFLERFKSNLSAMDGPFGGRSYKDRGEDVPALVHAGHAFVSGAGAGMIAAAFTTPFDVVKTRRQVVNGSVEVEAMAVPTSTLAFSSSVGEVTCDHGGAVVFDPRHHTSSAATTRPRGTLGHMAMIIREEGATALWRGNATRMIKVAPACAIMIGCYELGKRVLGDAAAV